MAQHDYNIANGTGAAVRSDLNNALAAIVSNNSGSTEPATTFAFQWWADTNASQLKLRNAANDAWIVIQELDGTLLMEDGTAGSPGLAFASDLNTGFFRPAADQLGIATNGVERVEFGTSEVVFNDGGADVDFRIEGDTNANLFFVDAGNDRVGIGESAPAAILTTVPTAGFSTADVSDLSGVGLFLQSTTGIEGDGNYGSALAWSRPTDSTRFKTAIAPVQEGADIDVQGLAFFTADDASATVSPEERVRINAAGNVGIGTSAPSEVLDLRSAGTTRIFFESNDGGSPEYRATIGVDSAGFKIQTRDGAFGNNTDRLTIDTSGRLLVGTSTSFQVGSPSNASSLQVAAVDSRAASSVLRASGNSFGPYFSLGKARGSLATSTIVQQDDSLGIFEFAGHDGTNVDSTAASIQAFVDGTPGANDMPGRLVFSTTPDGASSPVEVMRISQNGQVTITQDNSNITGLFINCVNGSFASNVAQFRTTRSNSSGFEFLRTTSNSGADAEHRLQGDGNAYADGSWNGGGADYAEYFEWLDSNPDAEDRRGISVVLDGDKIREAVAGEEPIGVISGNPSVVGDAAWNKWNEKYLRDDFGTYVRNEDGERQLNPAYDPDVEYINREDRPEWDCVGLMGKLRILKGQVTGARWIKMRDISDSVEEWLVR